MLKRVVVKGGLCVAESNYMRWIQIGAWYSLTLVRDLNLAGHKNDPPGLSQVIREVREEEEILHYVGPEERVRPERIH